MLTRLQCISRRAKRVKDDRPGCFQLLANALQQIGRYTKLFRTGGELSEAVAAQIKKLNVGVRLQDLRGELREVIGIQTKNTKRGQFAHSRGDLTDQIPRQVEGG